MVVPHKDDFGPIRPAGGWFQVEAMMVARAAVGQGHQAFIHQSATDAFGRVRSPVGLGKIAPVQGGSFQTSSKLVFESAPRARGNSQASTAGTVDALPRRETRYDCGRGSGEA